MTLTNELLIHETMGFSFLLIVANILFAKDSFK